MAYSWFTSDFARRTGEDKREAAIGAKDLFVVFMSRNIEIDTSTQDRKKFGDHEIYIPMVAV
jgi:hypothetical protein